MDKIPITNNGYKALQEELHILKTVERPHVIGEIAAARLHGDLSENAEYHAAKDRQGFIEGRIAELEEKLSRIQVIDVSKLSGDDVKFGATVTIIDEDTEEVFAYQLVGEDESDVKKGFLSISSPLGRALIGKKATDLVDVTTPNGSKEYTIQKVAYL